MFRFRSIICLLVLSSVCIAEDSKPGTLYWANGDILPGELQETNGNQLRWKSPLFRQPLVIDTSVLSAVRFKHTNEVVVTEEAFRLVTRSGNVLHGNLTGISETMIEMQSDRHSTILVDRSQLRSLRRLDNPSLIFLGPTGLNGWKTLSSKRKVDDWSRTDEGYLTTRRDKAQLFRQLDIPGRAEIEVVLSASGQMQFHLGLSDNPEEDLHLETWDDTLVALVDEEFVEIQEIPKGVKQLTLRIYWDEKKQTLSVYSEAGAELGSIKGAAENPGKPGIFIENHGPGLTVKSLRVSHWDGSKPKPVQKGQNRIHLTNGQLIYGTLQTLEGQVIKLLKEDEEEVSIPLTDIDSIYLADDEKTIADGSTNIFWLDGSRITGELVEIKDGNIGVKTNYSNDPIVSKLDKSNRLLFNSEGKTANNKPPTGPDKLTCSGGVLRGTLVGNGDDTGEAALRWKPVGGLNSSPLAPNCAARFERGKRTTEVTYDKKKYSDLLYLVSGDIVPCHIDSITEDALHITTAFAKGNKIPHDNVKAIELGNADALQSTGFDDRGWKPGGTGKTIKIDGNKVTFQGTGRISHKNVFSGGTASFKVKWDAGSYVVTTMRLFTSDGAGGCNLTMTGQQNRLYVSESTNFRGRMMPTSVSNNEADVRLVLKDERLTVFVNKKKVLTTNKLKRRRGSGMSIQVSQNQIFNRGLGNANGKSEFVISNLSAKKGTAVRQYVDTEAKDRALTVPRFRRDKPSTHVLIAPNGDLLRGKLRMVTQEQVRFSSRLEDFRFDRPRVAAIIWLHPEGEKDQPKPKEEAPIVRAVLDGGLGLVLVPERMTEEQLMGKSPVLGECAVPVSAIRELFAGKYEKKGEQFAYADWAITQGMEPRWDTEDAGGGDPAMALIGKKAGDFKLPTLKGQKFVLSEATEKDKKIVVLDFWATWCGPCVRAMPEYLEALKKLPQDKVQFVAVNQGEAKDVINGFLERRKEWDIKTVALDEDMQVAQSFQVSGIPHTVVIGTDGTVEWVHTGFKPGAGEELRANIQQMLDGSWERPTSAGDSVNGTESKLVGTDAKDFGMAMLGQKDEFQLSKKGINGGAGEIVILDFWATWCGPCVRALPEYLKVMEELEGQPVKFIAVNQAEREDLVKKFLEKREIKMSVGMDPDGKIAELFEVESLPQTVVIGPDGKIEWLHVGFKSGVAESLKKKVESLLKKESPAAAKSSKAAAE